VNFKANVVCPGGGKLLKDIGGKQIILRSRVCKSSST
jgi:hypothetical protein